MSIFAFEGVDRPGRADLRAAIRENHRLHIRTRLPGIRCILGGPLRAPQKDMVIGTLLIFEAANAEQVSAFMASDPYIGADLFETVSVREWTIGLGAIASDESER